jgi:HEAT repeat protein
LTALRAEDKPLRWVAATALGQLGPDAAIAIGPLREALDDPEPLVRQQATKALALIEH